MLSLRPPMDTAAARRAVDEGSIRWQANNASPPWSSEWSRGAAQSRNGGAPGGASPGHHKFGKRVATAREDRARPKGRCGQRHRAQRRAPDPAGTWANSRMGSSRQVTCIGTGANNIRRQPTGLGSDAAINVSAALVGNMPVTLEGDDGDGATVPVRWLRPAPALQF